MILIVAAFAIASCRKPEIIVPIVQPKVNCDFGACDTSKLDLVWQRPLSEDTSEWDSTPPLLFENSVLFTRYAFGEVPDTLKRFNSLTGRLEWTWSDFGMKYPSISSRKIYLTQNKYVFTTWNDVYAVNAINAINGQLSGKSIMQNTADGSNRGHPFMNVLDNTLYHVHERRENKRTIASHLVKSNLEIGKWDTIFTQPIINNLEPHLEMPALWKSPAGDEIVIFQIRYFDFQTYEQKIDVVAYNSTKKEMYFRFEDVDFRKTGSVLFPFVLKNKVYIPLNSNVVCYDLLEKKKLWDKNFGFDGFFTSGQPFLFVENQFFVKPSNRSLYQLDPDTGAEIWVDKNNGSGNSDMVYDNGVLYFTADGVGKIFALELASKKWLWSEPSPNKFPNKLNGNRRYGNANIGTGGIAIDAKNGYLYTSDFYFAMCLKLPKR